MKSVKYQVRDQIKDQINVRIEKQLWTEIVKTQFTGQVWVQIYDEVISQLRDSVFVQWFWKFPMDEHGISHHVKTVVAKNNNKESIYLLHTLIEDRLKQEVYK